MKVAFLMPSYISYPTGGYKVVYEYANRLAADGHDVSIYYPFISIAGLSRLHRIKHYFMRIINRAKFDRYQNTCTCDWFPLDKKVRAISVFELTSSHILLHDCYIATFWTTAYYLQKLKNKGRKFYLIQGYEIWGGREKDVHATYHYNLSKITISSYLKELIAGFGEKSQLIPNGFDSNRFFITQPIAERKCHKIIMMYHLSPMKNTTFGLEVLSLVRAKFNKLEVTLFGTPSAPTNLPEWITYHQSPENLNTLYNEALVYLGPSKSEGFGLTIGEAMLCGCAVVCSDIGGYKDLAIDNETALLFDFSNQEQAVDKICTLLSNESYRCCLAQNGLRRVQEYTWDRAYDSLIKLIGHE